MKYFENAPTFVYRVAYGKPSEYPIRGRSFAPTKNWKGLDVDADFKTKWLEDINSINGIVIRSTEVGKSPERPAHIVFIFADPNDEPIAPLLVKNLNKQEMIKAAYNRGPLGRIRIVVTYPIWKGKPGWEQWWNSVGDKIRAALNTTKQTLKEKLKSSL